MTASLAPRQALQGRGLAYGYQADRPVFAGIDIDIGSQEIVALLGGSGCGKSTLLRTLAGLQPPDAGTLQFLDAPLRAPHPRAAVVFQQASLLPWLNVQDNVAFGLDFKHQPKATQQAIAQRVQASIGAVGLAGKERLFPAQLSGGMAQRAALARALAREPRLLLADEPFSALDVLTRSDMQALLVEVVHRWHTAALLVTHDIDEALLVADRVLLMGSTPGVQAGAGRIVQSWRIDIAHPRRIDDERIAAMRLEILHALQILRGQAAAV